MSFTIPLGKNNSYWLNSLFMPSLLHVLFHDVFTALPCAGGSDIPISLMKEPSQRLWILPMATQVSVSWGKIQTLDFLTSTSKLVCPITSHFKTACLWQWAVAKLLSRARRTENVFKITTIPSGLFCSLKALLFPFCAKSEDQFVWYRTSLGPYAQGMSGTLAGGEKQKERF